MKTRYGIATLTAGVSLLAFAVQAAIARDRGSLAMRGAALVIKARGKPLGNIGAFRENVLTRPYPTPAEIPAAMRQALEVHEDTVAGHSVITLAPRTGGSRWHVVYIHGGSYVNELVAPHWGIVQALIDATGATVTVPLYPLAPKFNNRDAYPFLADVYRRVLTTTAASNVVLAGDSAGAGLAVGEALEFRRLGLPAPARLLLFSPWLDLTLADPAARAVEPRDVMLGIDALRLSGTWWAAGDDPRLPRLSPLYADLAGLPPMDLYQGGDDLLVVDARHFAAKANKAGNAIHYGEYPGGFHVFVAATMTPEAKDVFKRIGAVLPPDAAARPD